MLLDRFETALVSNPIRAAFQRYVEARAIDAVGLDREAVRELWGAFAWFTAGKPLAAVRS